MSLEYYDEIMKRASIKNINPNGDVKDDKGNLDG